VSCLVVGGSGFVGRHVVRRLLEAGHAVFNVDRVAPIRPLPDETPVVADVTRPEGLASAAQAARATSAVVWLAAAIRQRRSIDASTRADLELMVEAPLRLLDALAPAPTACVYLSSVQVYGRPERLPVDEDHQARPFTAYGVAKLCAEQMLGVACEARGVAFAALRAAFIYGPGQHAGNVIPRFLEHVRRGQPPVVHGPGADVRDDVFVGDVARAVGLALERGVSGVFNIGSGRPHSLRDVALAACRLGAAGLEPVHEPRDSGWVDRWYSIDRARRQLGFEPTAFADGLGQQWQAGA